MLTTHAVGMAPQKLAQHNNFFLCKLRKSTAVTSSNVMCGHFCNHQLQHWVQSNEIPNDAFLFLNEHCQREAVSKILKKKKRFTWSQLSLPQVRTFVILQQQTNPSRPKEPFVSDVMAYYVRMGQQPVYFNIYLVKVFSGIHFMSSFFPPPPYISWC